WLKEVNSQTLQQSILNLDVAFANFFKTKASFPKFKKKSLKQSFNVPQHVVLEKGKLIIPKFKQGIAIVLHRECNGAIRQATISKTPTGKYCASILVDTKETTQSKPIISPETTIGIDLGIKTFLVTSNGEEFENPKYLNKQLSKLKYVQRKYSKGKSKTRKYRLAILHEKVANQRKDFLHKTTSKLISEKQTICIEDLVVSNMVKNHCLAQAITDCG
ncbi:RNA-guided endonuclease TnpB family protein, partial [Flavobacterium sp. ZS1P14]|uniref:RNA-guided endonuclease TnpB family protein n=1 Tax=Flavobacterium sp. ZS1P14 TaxID=3401729 RepID=UPI003AB0BE27